MEKLTYMSADPEARAIYDARVKEMNDIYSGLAAKYKEGVEKGIEQGIEQGRAEERAKAEKEKHAEKMQSARKMLADGLPADIVAKYSGLTVEEVKSL